MKKTTMVILENLGGIFVTLCVLFCLFYIDYTSEQSKLFAATERPQRFGLFREDVGECDVFEGEWVYDESYPLYDSKNCAFLDQGFRCNENGRPDDLYFKWRWQPNSCDLPRFNPGKMLEKIRNKRVVFAGDSIGRNQWESLLCLLSDSIEDKTSVYEVNGNPISNHNGHLSFRFAQYNCSIEYFRSPFLVEQSRAPAGSPEHVKMTIKLDQMDWYEKNWRDADVVVLNMGHWWNYEKTLRSGSYFQESGEVKLEIGVEEAYRKAAETVVKWMQGIESDSLVVYRTYAPVHFRDGDWKSGGHCHSETMPDKGVSFVPSGTWRHVRMVDEVLSSSSIGERKYSVMNITAMAGRRKDGHPSVYYLSPEPAPFHRQDCSHWCLPGVPDAWNELLYAKVMRL